MADWATPKLVLAAMMLGILAAMASCEEQTRTGATPADAGTGDIAVEPEPRPLPTTL